MNPIIRNGETPVLILPMQARICKSSRGKLFLFPFVLMILSFFSTAQGQVSNFTFNSIPFSDPDLVSPFRGAEKWHSSNPSQMINHPNEAAMEPPMDIYHRSSIAWDELESAQGVYTWRYFDKIFNDAIDNKQKISFGIMTQNPGRTDGPKTGGAYMSYPLYLHDLMQAEGSTSRDWVSSEDAFWVPNYNSPNYLGRFEALLNAIADHINRSSHNGVSYRDALGYVDIRGYGSWGEWHMVAAASSINDYPSGRRPLAASLIRIINAHINAFPNHPLVSIISIFDGNQFGNTMVPPEVGYHALTASNAWGKIGWRRDNWGWTDGYISNWLERNPTVYNGMRFDTAIMNRWKYAPILGEPACGGTNNGGPSAFWDVPRQVKFYHASMIGNGNFCNENSKDKRGRDSMRMAWKYSGYRLVLEGGNMSTSISPAGQMNISLNWKNIGFAPVYENWDVTYELQNQSTNSVVWSGVSKHKLKGWIPQSDATIVNDSYTLPENLPGGTYRLVLKIKDPINYRSPLPLAIQGRRADGSYLLREDITLGVEGPLTPLPANNLAPQVNAGADLRLAAGVTTASFSGTAIDPDAQGSEVNLIVMMGESNASGIAPNSSATPLEREARPSVKILNNYYLRFEDLDLDQNNNIDNATPWNESHSWEIGLADAVEAGLLPNPTYMVKAAASGTRIDQWLLNGGGTWWENMRNKMDVAISLLRAQNRPIKITIWYSLGLNDAVQGIPAAVYRTRIEQFFRDFRAVYGANIQVYMTRFHEYADKPGDGLGHPFNSTIDAIGDADPNIFIIPTQGASFNPGERFIHFDYAGMKLIASRMVNAMRSNMGSGTGSISSVTWSKISGPNGVSITHPNQLSTTVTGLQSGTYSFLLEAIDNLGSKGRDTLLVEVESGSPPFANAGNDQTVTLPANTTTLNGTGSDPDGSISSYAWTKVSGPAGGNIESDSAASTSITGMNQGTYVFRFTVTDNNGQSASDDVQVIVNAAPAPAINQAPVANAGSNMTIQLPVNSATLHGNGNDPDGSVISFKWTKLSGPAGGNIQSDSTANTEINGLNEGTYSFRLTVTDNAGAQGSADIQVIVLTAPPPVENIHPVANAGGNINITLPVNSVNLNGSASDADGSLASYEWTKVSGPAGGNIQSPGSAATTITDLNAGTYIYRLTVTDNRGATASDDMQLIVSAAPVIANMAPVANAGNDITITLPDTSVNLNGSVSADPDGNIVSYSWRKISGPNGSIFSSMSIASPVVVALSRGVHEFELTVTDNRGATASDRVTVTVIKINQKPVARTARDTITVSLPVQNAELNATDSYDPDGTITKYQWTFRNGPKEPKVLSPESSKTIIADLIAGNYEFDLVLTDNDGDVERKAVVVMVKTSTNRKLIPDVSVYPNPATSMVNLKISSDVEGRTVLTFYDMNGRPVMTDVFVKGYGSFTRQVNISRLPIGTYSVLIQVDQTQKVVEKLIKF